MRLLPIYEPVLNSYNVYGAVFSIISNNEDYLPWLYNNFIEIAINNYDETPYFTDHFSLFEYSKTSSCPWLHIENQRIKR